MWRVILLLSAIVFVKPSSAENVFTFKLGKKLHVPDIQDTEMTKVYAVDVNPEDIAKADAIVIPTGDKLFKADEPQKSKRYVTYAFEGGEGDLAEAELTACQACKTVRGYITSNNGTEYHLRVFNGKHYLAVLDLKDRLEKYHNIDTAAEIKALGGKELDPAEYTQRLYKFLMDREVPQNKLDEALEKGKKDSTTKATLSLKVYFTKEFEKAVSDVKGTIENEVGMMNQGFRNSKILIDLNLVCIERFLVPENPNMMDAMQVYKGNAKNLHGGADLTLLFLENTRADYCGLGDYMDTDYPLALIDRRCIGTEYGAGHELGPGLFPFKKIIQQAWLGHNLGAAHDTAATSEGFKGWNKGYLLPGSNRRTIMAYDSDQKHDVVINYFSDDVVRDRQGEKVGAPTEDNSKMLNERRFMYELIGDEKIQCAPNFEPTPKGGTVKWGEWKNFGCVDSSKPMTRTQFCYPNPKYFPCPGFIPKTETKQCKCKDNVNNCEAYKKDGDCNPAAETYVSGMKYCPYTCSDGECGGFPGNSKCRDKSYMCGHQKTLGSCEKGATYYGWAMDNCEYTCTEGKCAPCADTGSAEGCKNALTYGWCKKGNEYFWYGEGSCKKSCGLC